ncbi:MAG TPA: glycosyltransferase family 39 protein [Gaiellaceae bacterium]|nr:glycosyltransferase family 39 protein [Gaiellaceae bacterium]
MAERVQAVPGADARRLVRAVPAWAWVAALVVCSAGFRYLLARRMVAPWIMVDELIYSEMAKSFAATGHFLVRGQPFGVPGLYPLVISPAYRAFGSVPDVYRAAKGIDSVVMSLAAVPAYLLARRVLERPLALLAALLAVAVPSMLYTGTLMTENLFYPLFLLCVLALVAALDRPTALRQLAVLVVAALCYLTRVQAVFLLPAIALAPPLALWYRRDRWRALRSWWVLYALIALGVVAAIGYQEARGRSLLGAYQAATSTSYTAATSLRWLLYHVGELSLYVGVAPLAAFALLAWLGRGLPRRLQLFLAASLPVAVLCVVEVAVFASSPGVSRIEERNMFYVASLLLIALLAWIEQGLPRPRAAAVAALAAAALTGAVPYSGLLNGNASADTLAFLPLWTLQDTVITLDEVAAVVVVAAICVAALFLLAPPRWALALPAVVLAWFAFTLWAIETNPHGGAHHASLEALFGGTTKLNEPDWIDRAVGRDANVAFVWSGDAERKFSLWTNEFFNRSIRRVYDLGPAAPGGLPSTAVHVDRATGRLVGAGPAQYALTDDSVHLAGRVVGSDPGRSLALYRLSGPLRVAYVTSGVYPDGWSGPTATYRRFDCAGGTVRALVAQDPTLFPGPQTVNGVRVRGSRWIAAPLAVHDGRCTARFRVAPTRVPGPQDERTLGIHFQRFAYAP